MAIPDLFNHYVNCDAVSAKSHAPISKIPFEVLSAIFRAGALSNSNDPSSCQFGLLVSHVTRVWREVALSNPYLWTKIWVNSHRYVTNREMVESFEKRSRNLPIELYASIRFTKSVVAREHERSLFQVISILTPRLRHLGMDCTWQGCLSYVVYYLRRTAPPLLESIDINLPDHPHDGPCEDVDVKLFHETPSLKSVRLRGIGLQCCEPPLDTVGRLEIHDVRRGMEAPTAKFRSMLNGLKSLTHLVLCELQLMPDWDHTTSIDLPSLRSLHIRPSQAYRAQGSQLLRWISAPNLETLSLERFYDIDVRAIPPGTHTTVPKLVLLSTHVRMDSLTWYYLGKALPGVTELVQRHGKCQSFLGYLRDVHRSPVPESIWPNLESVTLFGKTKSIPPDAILPAVIARANAGLPLKRLGLSKASIAGIGEEDLKQLIEELGIVVEEVNFDQDLSDDQYWVDWNDNRLF